VAPNGLLDQQHIALMTGAEARAAAGRQATPLVQEGVGGSARRLIGRAALGSLGRIGSIFLKSGKGSAFFDALGSDDLLAGGYASWLAAQRDLPRAVRRLAVSPTMQHQDLISHVTAIRDLIHREQVSAARRVLDLISVGASEEPAIAKLRRALTPPTVRPSTRKDSDRTRAYEWLRQHAWEYRGQWVAVAEDGLIAAAPTLKQLRQQLEGREPTQQPLIHKL
jgi:uncharacterized protein DUF5678